MEIEPVAHGPINDVFLAINLYVSTGDHIGEGIAQPSGNNIVFHIAYNPRELEDADNAKLFKLRVKELAARFKIADFPDRPTPSQFTIWSFEIPKTNLAAFAGALVRDGGKAGYGSNYDLVKKHFADALARIAAEGENAE